MGALGVGISEASLKAVLGEPHRKLPPANNAATYVYFLGKADRFPYLAAAVKANRVLALQISGTAPAAAYGFNQVNLGDSTEKLRAQFGNPFHVGPSGLGKTELWTYGPWPSRSRCGRTASPRSGSAIRPLGQGRFDCARAGHTRDSAWRPLKVSRLGSVTPAR